MYIWANLRKVQKNHWTNLTITQVAFYTWNRPRNIVHISSCWDGIMVLWDGIMVLWDGCHRVHPMTPIICHIFCYYISHHIIIYNYWSQLFWSICLKRLDWEILYKYYLQIRKHKSWIQLKALIKKTKHSLTCDWYTCRQAVCGDHCGLPRTAWIERDSHKEPGHLCSSHAVRARVDLRL